MKNRTNLCSFFTLVTVAALLLSMLSGVTFAATGSLSHNTGTRHVVCDALSTKAQAYYTGDYTYENLSQLSGVSAPTNSYTTTQNNELYDALQTLMTDTHKVYAEYNPSGEQSNELSYLWDFSDAEAGSSQYLYFYTDVLADDYGTGDMQREHVWPKSNASYYQLNGGADLHHLRPSIGTVNSAKSNYTFANVRENYSSYSPSSVDGQEVIWYNGNSGVLEVRDNVKGDVARILLYVYCRWGQPNLYSDVSSAYLPEMDSDDSANGGIRAIDDLDTLLQWMEMDPVDDWEMGRNDQAENFQGNRNVFIDYPEFAWLLFNQTPPNTLQTPSGEAAGGPTAPTYTITATSSNTNYGTVSLVGNVITATPKAGYEVSGYTLITGSATVSQNGNVFTVTASSDCTVRINFRAITYTVNATVNNTAYGSVSVNGYTITATPNEGYQVSGYTLVSGSATVSRSGNVFTVKPSTNCTVQINFSQIAYTVTAATNNSSYGTVSTNGYTITATPKSGYEVVGYEVISGTATLVRQGNVFTVTPTSDCIIQINFAPISYEMTVTVNSSEYGSVSVDGYVITATPNEGYQVAGYTVLRGSAAVVQEENVFTVTPGSNCTVCINFVALEGCTINFVTPQGVSQSSVSGYDGEVITLPTPEGTPAANAYEYTFIGWTDAQAENLTTAPTLYEAGESYTLVENTTLYALYSYSIGGSGESHYTLLTDISDLTANAQVVIASKNSDYAISTTQSYSYRNAAAITKEATNQTISFTGAVCEFVVHEGSVENTWAFYDATNEGYIYASSSRSNAMNTQSTLNDNASFLISIDNGEAIMTAQGTNTRNSIGYQDYGIYSYFACFNATTSTRGAVELYMMTTAGTTYYTTVLASVCEHNYVERIDTEATCTSAGTTTYICSLCSDHYTQTVEALGHSYSYTTTVEPTEADQGYDIYTCTRCGLTQNQNYTQPTGYNYTVTFSVPNGVSEIAPMVCNSLSSITLPEVSGTPSEDTNNAQFIGWSAVTVDNQEESGTYYAAGEAYKATSDIMLYALYSYQISGGDAVAFTKGSSGEYVIASLMNGTYYAIKSDFTLNSGKIFPEAITVENGVVTDENAENFAITLTYDGSQYYTLYNGTNYLTYAGSSTNFATSTSAYSWTIDTGINGTWRISETTALTRSIAYYNYSAGARFGVYSNGNITSGSSTYYDVEILPIAEGGATIYYTTTFFHCTHEETQQQIVHATCTQNGSVTTICSTCDQVISSETIEANGHEYEAVVTAPTCEADGYTTYTCNACADSYIADTVAATGHDYATVVTAPTCTDAGFTTYTCCACSDSYVADEVAATGHSYAYTDNGENHTVTCANCDYNANEEHNYVDGTCICGAVEVVEPKYEPKDSLKFTMSISVGAEMTVTYNIMGADVNSYSDFYLEVKKDVAGGEPITTIYGITADREQMTAKVNPATGEALMYQVTYKGINAKEMGDSFSTTLYAVGEDGTIYYGATVVDSIKSFLVGKIDAETSIPELKTMAVDMLKYGAAAQVRLGYNTENLVTADLTEEQLSYATQEIPEAVDYSGASGLLTGTSVNANIVVAARVQLHLSCVYSSANPDAMRCIVTDEDGTVLKELPVTNKSNIMFTAIYEDVGAKEMRDVINVTFYEGDAAISKTISWSVESYVAQVRAKTNVTEDELNMVNAMLTYGDAVAAYMLSVSS